jgi:hypothetical protein
MSAVAIQPFIQMMVVTKTCHVTYLGPEGLERALLTPTIALTIHKMTEERKK